MVFLFQPPRRVTIIQPQTNICLSGEELLQYLFKRTSAEVLPGSLFQQAGCRGVSVLPGQEPTAENRRRLRAAQGRKTPAGTAFPSPQPASRCRGWERQQEPGWGGFCSEHRAASTLSGTRTNTPARRERKRVGSTKHESRTQVQTLENIPPAPP